MIKACLFDVDGVLIQSIQAHREAWKIFAREMQLAISMAELEKATRGYSTSVCMQNLLGRDLSEAAILRHVQHKEKLASALFKPIESLTPGIVPFLTDLRARGIKIGYATNTERANLESKFVGTPLPELADFIATATDVTYPKPHPEIYLKAAQVLGAAASECLVFEDSPPGITAGQTAGMKVVMLRTDYNQMIAADDVAKVITDFRELTAAAALSL